MRTDHRRMSYRLHMIAAFMLRMLVARRNAGLRQAIGGTHRARSEHRQ